MATKQEIQRLNQTIFDELNDPGLAKHAADTVTSFTRTRIREDGILRNLMPVIQATNDDLVRQVDTPKPVIVVDKEPDNPPAISVPFGGQPIMHYVRGPRYMIGFQRIVGPRFTVDTMDLRTWQMDIRQVLSDNAIKDMLAEEDSRFISAINTALIGQNSTTPTSGSVQWKSLSGGVIRENWAESLKVMPSTPFHLHPTRILFNNVTIYDFVKWGRDEMGGDLSEKLFRDGFSETEFDGKKLMVTIKRDLVPDGTAFYFSAPKFIGKFYTLEDMQLFLRRFYWVMEWFPWEEVGGSIGHTGGLTRIDFT
jgi:hypothetical protein